MKVCPDCKYPNPDSWDKCEICKTDLKGVRPTAAAPVQAARSSLWQALAGLAAALVLAGGSIYLYRHIGRTVSSSKTASADVPEIVVTPAGKQLLAPQTPDLPGKKAEKASGDAEALLSSMAELKYPGEEEISYLKKSLSDSAPRVRAEALMTLTAWVHNGADYVPGAGELFVRALADQNNYVRATAALQLELLCSGLPEGMTLAQAQWFSSGDPAPVMKELEARMPLLLAEPHENVRVAAVMLASAMQLPRWEQTMRDIMEKDQDIMVRIAAAGALSRIGDKKATAFLLLQASNEDEELRGGVANLLALSQDPRADAALKTLAQDKSPSVRVTAQGALEMRKPLPARSPQARRSAK